MSKVLLVNDCRFESLIMKDMLDSLGYDVEISDEFEALEKIKFSYPDTVIVNLIMKNIQGDELIAKIKQVHSDIRCILSSSNPIKLDTYRGRMVDAVIHTPLKKEGLIAVLETRVREKVLKDLETKKHTKEAITQGSYRFCPYCGEKLSSGFSFCPNCGKKV